MRLRVNYNVQPWVGMLTWAQYPLDGGLLSLVLPSRGGAGSPLWKPIAGAASKLFSLPAIVGAKSSTKKAASSS